MHTFRSNDVSSPQNVEDILPPPFAWIEIPSGKVILVDASIWGGSKGGVFEIDSFSIAKYSVTNGQYQVFVDADDGYANSLWWDYSEEARAWRKTRPQSQPRAFPGDDHPRGNVSWFDAVAFCRWLSGRTALQITLPTEKQWQRAAIGDMDWQYPWGIEFDKNRCNSSESGIGQTTPVIQYPQGASPYGAFDMSGNVWEWCLTEWGTENDDLNGDTARVRRGGSYNGLDIDLRSTNRYRNPPGFEVSRIGFRFARS
jgi:formylglycine-generating enzyme required for sulfatase activity